MTPRAVVQEFVEQVRSGKNLERAFELMAPQVLAHQVISELEQTVERTPQNYVDHVLEMQHTYGAFVLEIEEILASGDRVYVRWRQRGHHQTSIEGFAPSGKPLLERGSAVYRVRGDKIVEYWIQIDRAGLRAQLERG